MDARQRDALVQRLVANPQDQAAIAEAHAHGQQDPQGYAQLLEKVGLASTQASVSCHWLNEAANVWQLTFQDAQRAANALLCALDRDPTSVTTLERLAQLYGSDKAGLAAAYERRAQAMERFAAQEPDWLPQATQAYEQLAQYWAEPPADLARAKAAYAKAIDLEPTNPLSIYNLRELHKTAGEYAEALPYFGMELALVTDAERKRALLADEVEVAKRAGRIDRAEGALRQVVRLDPRDPAARQKLGALLLERYRAGELTDEASRHEGCELFVGLAEQYPGEHGFLYSLCALELVPSHDRAVQLAIHFGEQLGRLLEVAPLAAAYVRDNPHGVMGEAARRVAGSAVAPSAPKPSTRPPSASSASSVVIADGATASSAAPRVEASPRPVIAQPKLAARSAESRAAAGTTVEQLLEQADELAQKNRKNEAIATFRQVLDLDPINPDALNYLQETLPLKKKYAELRDILLGAVAASGALDEDRLEWLRELAAVCETHVRDVDTAAYAWQQIIAIDPEDEEAKDQLKRLLEKARRWDQLVAVLRSDADRTEDVEARIAIERQIIKLHTTRTKDLAAAGQAWANIAGLSPGDEGALLEAVQCFEKSERADLAADAIAEHVGTIEDRDVKRDLYMKLGSLRGMQGQPLPAAQALEEGAEELADAEMWGNAEQYFAQAEAWERAARAADEHAQLVNDDLARAALLARAAGYHSREGEVDEAVARLERAVELAPASEEFSNSLEQLLVSANRVGELVQLFLSRAAKLRDKDARVHLRRRAAITQRDRMGDVTAARESFSLVLSDVEDEETLAWLAGEAEGRGDAEAAVGYLRRLGKVTPAAEDKIRHALHEASLRGAELSDVEGAVERYEHVLDSLDAKNLEALSKLSELELSRGNHARAAEILERELEATPEQRAKLEVASRLAEIYEIHLGRPEDAIRLLSFVHETDPDDFDATQRLCGLAEACEKWSLVADLMGELISVEGDEEQLSEMTRRLSQILHLQLGEGARALSVLANVADQGDEPCRQSFVDLGDELGDKAAVAERLVSWYAQATPSPARTRALHGAFQRYLESGRAAEAIAVGVDLVRSKSAEPEIAAALEELAIGAKDLTALALAHQLHDAERSGNELGAERVRQAEVLAAAGVPSEDAVSHGESALSESPPNEVDALLTRLAALCNDASAKVDVYERQIARGESLEERLAALVKAADVAVSVEDPARASSLFEAALAQGLEPVLLDSLVSLAQAADERSSRTQLREILANALATGGQATRDGGRTRSKMLRLAAALAHEQLDDMERAFRWLGDAVILHVEDEGLNALEDLAGLAGDHRRAETVLSRALGEVFDGPLVRRLLARRAALRQERLADVKGAAADLKQLHDLSPGDAEVNERLTALYEELGDQRGVVGLLEDQILRSRDKEFRAELSRKVARIWQTELDDPREAADAWRRVIRLSGDDEEAKAGLARAKEAMLGARSSDQSPAPQQAAPQQKTSQQKTPQHHVAAPKLVEAPEIPQAAPAGTVHSEHAEVPVPAPTAAQAAAVPPGALDAPTIELPEFQPAPSPSTHDDGGGQQGEVERDPLTVDPDDDFDSATEVMSGALGLLRSEPPTKEPPAPEPPSARVFTSEDDPGADDPVAHDEDVFVDDAELDAPEAAMPPPRKSVAPPRKSAVPPAPRRSAPPPPPRALGKPDD